MRRFTDDEDTIIVRDYAGYVPTGEIAAKIGRTEQTLLQRIKRLGLHRSWTIMRALPSAPDHLKGLVGELGPDEWIAAYHAWREEERRKAADDAAQADERARALRAAQAAGLGRNDGLTRNQKMLAMRTLGLNNEEIAKHFGITRERVRQIIDPDYKASPTKLSPKVKLAQPEEGRRRRAPASSTRARNGSWDSGARRRGGAREIA